MPEQEKVLGQVRVIRMYLNQYEYAVKRFEHTVAWNSLKHLEAEVDALYESAVPEDLRA